MEPSMNPHEFVRDTYKMLNSDLIILEEAVDEALQNITTPEEAIALLKIKKAIRGYKKEAFSYWVDEYLISVKTSR